jgi:hypothetical protein
MVRQNKYVKKIAVVLGIACILGGCASPPNRAKEDTGALIEADIGLVARAAPEGITLSFSAIPDGTTRMFVNISTWDRNKELAGARDIVSSFTDIRGSDLERVKTAGKITVPFVQSGKVYDIAVFCERENEPETYSSAECIAGGGIYYKDGLGLALNESRTAVTLSAAPEFSREVQYAPGKYRYGVTIRKGEYWSIGVGDDTQDEAMTWVFQPLVNDDIAASGYLERGEYPAYAIVYCKAVYDDLTWSVELAKSGEFTVRFQ